MLCKFVLSEKDIGHLEDYVNSGLKATNAAGGITEVLIKIIKQAGCKDEPASISEIQLAALEELIVLKGIKYGKLVIKALGPEKTKTYITTMKNLSFNEAATIIQYANAKFGNKGTSMPKKTKSITDILMDDNVSKEQVIEIMYDALSTMQRYNGHSLTHCLVEAIKGSDVVYEE